MSFLIYSSDIVVADIMSANPKDAHNGAPKRAIEPPAIKATGRLIRA
jgi:hypothetical protein